MKFVLMCCLIAAMATIVLTRSAMWGQRTPNDRILYSRNVTVYPRYLVVGSEEIQFARRGMPNSRPITAVYVIDNFRNNSGATAILKSGGPKYSYANIVLRSQKSRGFNASVLIYGLN